MAVEGNYFSVTRYVGGTFSCQLSFPKVVLWRFGTPWAGIHNSSNKLAVNFVNWRANSVGTVNIHIHVSTSRIV